MIADILTVCNLLKPVLSYQVYIKALSKKKKSNILAPMISQFALFSFENTEPYLNQIRAWHNADDSFAIKCVINESFKSKNVEIRADNLSALRAVISYLSNTVQLEEIFVVLSIFSFLMQLFPIFHHYN